FGIETHAPEGRGARGTDLPVAALVALALGWQPLPQGRQERLPAPERGDLPPLRLAQQGACARLEPGAGQLPCVRLEQGVDAAEVLAEDAVETVVQPLVLDQRCAGQV